MQDVAEPRVGDTVLETDAATRGTVTEEQASLPWSLHDK